MAVQTSGLNLDMPIAQAGAWRTRILTMILMAAIASIFWVDSRYPALMKRYNAGTQIKATGALTFGGVYTVDPSMPYTTRVWRTTVNWLDANRVGMTFSFLFGPAALAFLSTLRRRRTRSRYLNVLIGTVSGVPLGVCSNCIAPHCAWNVRIRDERRIGSGGNVCLARSQHRCPGDDIRPVSLAASFVEAGNGCIFDPGIRPPDLWRAETT